MMQAEKTISAYLAEAQHVFSSESKLFTATIDAMSPPAPAVPQIKANIASYAQAYARYGQLEFLGVVGQLLPAEKLFSLHEQILAAQKDALTARLQMILSFYQLGYDGKAVADLTALLDRHCLASQTLGASMASANPDSWPKLNVLFTVGEES